MDYGIQPGNPLEALALRLGTVPIPVLDALLPLVQARALLVAVEHGVFEALKDAPRTAPALAAARGLDSEATEMLLRTLTASGYLEQRHDAYRLSRGARRSLLRGAPLELWGFVRWCGHLWDEVARLEELVTTGVSADLHGRLEGAETWALYQRAMLEVARFQAPILARRLALRPGARRLLDLGGGHGLFAAEIVRRHPGLAAEVIERAEALPAARALAAEAGIAGLVTHRAGDLLRDDLGLGEVDLVLLANVLHHFPAAESQSLLRRIHRALAPGGQIAIWEIDVPAADAPPSLGDLSALFFRLTSSGGDFRSAAAEGWLREAGFAATRLVRLRRLPGNLLLLATR